MIDIIFINIINKYPLLFKYINSEYLRYNDYKLAINLNPRAVYYAIENDAYIKEFGADIVNKDPNNIKLLKEIDSDIIITALKKDGMLLGYIRDCYHGEITFEMCNAAINQNLYAMKYVPERFKKYFNILDRKCMTFIRKPNGDFGYNVDEKFVCF